MHIHICLSPCGYWGKSPKKIIQKSLEKNLDIIGICDHKSAENVEAVIKAGNGKGFRVILGMEICSKEEVHVLLNGLCIASHVDRPVFGIISQLGFIPPDFPLDGVEIS